MSSKILDYADSVISKFNTTSSEFINIEASGTVDIDDLATMNGGLKVVSTSSAKLEIDTSDNLSGSSYLFPEDAVPSYDAANSDRTWFLQATPVSSGSVQMQWASFDTAGVQLSDVNGFNISGSQVGNFLYMGTDSLGQPEVKVDQEGGYQLIESREVLNGNLVRNSDEMLITTEELGSGKQLAKISVSDLIQSVQILATDIQVIGYANNKVITQDGIVRIEVDKDGLGDTILSQFNADGFLTEGTISTQGLSIGRDTTKIDLIGDEQNSFLTEYGFSFKRGGHLLNMAYYGTHDFTIKDDKISLGSGSASFTCNANSYFIQDYEGAYIVNDGYLTIDEDVSVSFANTFSCSVPVSIDQSVSIGADVEFQEILGKILEVGDRAGSNPYSTLEIKQDSDTFDKCMFEVIGVPLKIEASSYELKAAGGQSMKYSSSTGLQITGNFESIAGELIVTSDITTSGGALSVSGDASIGGNLTVDGSSINFTDAAAELNIFNVTCSAGGTVTGKYFKGLSGGSELTIDQIKVVDAGGTPTILLNGLNGELNAAAYNTSSSLHVKENIQNFENGLNTIMKMNPVSYNRINQSKEKREIGFIAEEMEEYLPQVVNSKGAIKGISYQNIVPVLVSALQEQQKKIEELESKISK